MAQSNALPSQKELVSLVITQQLLIVGRAVCTGHANPNLSNEVNNTPTSCTADAHWASEQSARLQMLEDALHLLGMTTAKRSRGRKSARYCKINSVDEIKKAIG